MDIGANTPQEPEDVTPTVSDPASFDAMEVGAALREARTALQRDLADVASDLRIRQVYLEAIEDGRLSDLPGPAYTTGFLRAYGDFLGLDGRDIVNRYKAAGGANPGQTDLHLPSPVEEGRLPTGSVLLLAALLAIGAYGGWYYMASTGDDPVETVAALPDQLANLVDQTDGAGDAAPADGAVDAPRIAGVDGGAEPAREAADETETTAGLAASATAPTSQAVTRPDTPDAAAEPSGDREDAATVAAATDRIRARSQPDGREISAASSTPIGGSPEPAMGVPPERTALVAPQGPGMAPLGSGAADRIRARAKTRIVLQANTDSWLEVRADGADPVYSGLLREGDSYHVPERPGLTLMTGNAGGIDILVDGKAIPKLGPPGAVKRNVVLDPDRLLGLLTE